MSVLPIPKGVASPLSLATFNGTPAGMARDLPQHEIQDTEAWTLVDANLMDPGFIRRRGPLTETASSVLTNSFALGIARVQDAAGVEQTAHFTKTTTPNGKLTGFGNTSSLSYTWPYTPSSGNPAELFDAKDALFGGVLIGTASGYDNPANKALLLWQGASKNDATSISLSSPIARGDGTVSVSSATNVSVGHFLFKSSQLIGRVKSISGTTLTLADPALIAATTSIDVQALRGLSTRVATGRITTSTAATVGLTVNGGSTKFKAQGLGSGTWDLYTPDYTWIGTVSSVTSNSQLVLSAEAAVALTNGAYIAIKTSASYTGTPYGWMATSFGGHQFYADGNKLRFSSTIDREAVDVTNDGDFLVFSADPIRALIATQNDLLVVTEHEAFALTGAVGTTPDKWRGERVHDNGTICGMACLSYKGGAIWTGTRGIWYYDGSSPVNITQKLDEDWRLALSTFSSATTRAYAAIVKNHLLVWVEAVKSGVFNIVKDQTTTNVTRPTFVISLDSGAISLWQNVELRGGINPPDSAALGTSLLAIQTLESATNKTRVVVGDTLFTDSGADAYTCNGAAAGPNLYVETKKYAMGDGQRLKLFRMFLLHFWAAGGNIRFDTVAGLNGTGATSTTEFWATTAFVDKRVKFNRKSQYLALRLYQSAFSGDPALAVSANITRITIGQWALGFKWKRPGRV